MFNIDYMLNDTILNYNGLKKVVLKLISPVFCVLITFFENYQPPSWCCLVVESRPMNEEVKVGFWSGLLPGLWA